MKYREPVQIIGGYMQSLESNFVASSETQNIKLNNVLGIKNTRKEERPCVAVHSSSNRHGRHKSCVGTCREHGVYLDVFCVVNRQWGRKNEKKKEKSLGVCEVCV